MVATLLQIVRKSSFKEIPWRNGAGITHEVMRVPAAGEAFLWRLSVAHIGSSGPFSDFAGYRRDMVLLRGKGLALTFSNGEKSLLQNIGDAAQFDGGLAAHCDLLDGPCVDLNFMVSKPVRADARVLRLDKTWSTHAAPGRSALPPGPSALLPGPCALIFSVTAPLLLEGEGCAPQRLEPWDLAVISQGSARFTSIEPDQSVPDQSAAPRVVSSSFPAVFIATINH